MRARAKRPEKKIPPSIPRIDTTPTGLRPRQRVRHARFGDGVVLEVEGAGYHARARIDFPASGGAKWLVVAYAKLETLS